MVPSDYVAGFILMRVRQKRKTREMRRLELLDQQPQYTQGEIDLYQNSLIYLSVHIHSFIFMYTLLYLLAVLLLCIVFIHEVFQFYLLVYIFILVFVYLL
jgi:hypothetical protein